MAKPRIQVLALLLLAVLPALPALRSRSFFSPDETSYAEVAREMRETQDPVVPRLDGHPWLEKPPLVYWLLGVSFALFGWGIPAAVLLNSLLTGLVALVLAWHVGRTGSRRAGLLAGVAYLTMLLPLAAARTALTDPALTLCTTVSLVAFLAPGRPMAALSGLTLGCGMLAKGPVAPLVVVPAALVAVALAPRPRRWTRLAGLLVLSVLVAAPWHLALASRGLWGEYTAVFLGQQVASRALEVWRIAAPWWTYLPVLWLAAFPWGTHLAPAIARQARRAGRDAAMWAELTAVVIPLGAFSLAPNKLPHYLLPLLPLLAAWLGRAADEWWDQGDEPATRRWGLAAGLGGAAVLASGAVAAQTSALAPFLPRSTAFALAGGAAVMLITGVVAWRKASRLALASLAALAISLQTWIDAGLVPHLDRQLLERPLAETVAAHLPAGGLPVAHRWWRASLVAYGLGGWAHSETQDELDATLEAAGRARRPVLALTLVEFEGDVRAAAWRRGGVAVETLRLAGLAGIGGEVLEAVGFSIQQQRDGRRWFYDANTTLPGESGFSGVEGNRWTPSFRWAVTRLASLSVPVRPPGAGVLRLRAWGPPGGSPQRLTIRVNECEVGRLTLDRFPRSFALAVPQRCLRPGIQVLSFDAEALVVPARVDPGSHDGRTLAFALDWLALDPAAATVRLAPSR